jgi:hypothetical protein
MKYLEAVKKYFGMPYKKAWYTPKDKEYYYPMYVDCWGVTRRAWIDLEEELDFQIGWWNQGYQVDTLPIVLKEEEMQPGDLIFYSAKLYNKNGKVHAHEMVHVEIFVGGETGSQSIGARRKNGVVQMFDTFRFESKRFYNTKHHFRSIDTWIDGICKSWCPDHEWRPNKKGTNYYANIHRKKRKEKERAQLNEINLTDYVQSMEKYTKTWYINFNYRNKPITSWMEKKGFLELDRIDLWNYKARLSWVTTLDDIDYARFKIGFHIVNRIPTLYKLTQFKNVWKMWENLKISWNLGYLEDGYIDIIREHYIIDSIPELWRFLNWKNSGKWELVNNTYSNEFNETVIDDIMGFKHKIMGIRKLESNEIDSSSESEESKAASDDDQTPNESQNSPDKKPKTLLDPISDPNLNPNLPDLLYK